MKYGTGLQDFAHAYRERFYDVGIAEQHAVTFVPGLPAEDLFRFLQFILLFCKELMIR